jgi:hypothetical protein
MSPPQNSVYPIWFPLPKNMIPEGHRKRGIFEGVLKGDDLVSDNERYDIKPRVSVRERR